MRPTMWKSLLAGACALLWLNSAPLAAQTPTTPISPAPPAATETAPALPIKVMRELNGVKLDMSRAEVRTLRGKPSQTTKEFDEFKLEGDDLLTVRYDAQDKVHVIQFYCTDAKRAPDWADVIGEASLQTKPNGSKFARQIVSAENFWISMFQNEAGSLTTITLSR